MRYLLPEHNSYVHVELLQRINKLENALYLMQMSGLGEVEMRAILDTMGKQVSSHKRQRDTKRGSAPSFISVRTREAVQTVSTDQDVENPTAHELCQVCKKSTEGDHLVLLCDGLCGPDGEVCNKEYHYSCVGVQRNPKGEWHGPCCRAAVNLQRPQRIPVGRRTPNFTLSQRVGANQRTQKTEGSKKPTKKQGGRVLHPLLNGSKEFPFRNEMHLKDLIDEGVTFSVKPAAPLEDEIEERVSMFDTLTRLPEGFCLSETKSKVNAKFTGYQLNSRIDHTRVAGGIVFNAGTKEHRPLHMGKFLCKHMAILSANLMQQFMDEHTDGIEVQGIDSASTMIKHTIQDGMESKAIKLIDNFQPGESKRCDVCYETFKAYCGVSNRAADVMDGQRSTSPFQERFLNEYMENSSELENILRNPKRKRTGRTDANPSKPSDFEGLRELGPLQSASGDQTQNLQILYDEALNIEDLAGILM